MKTLIEKIQESQLDSKIVNALQDELNTKGLAEQTVRFFDSYLNLTNPAEIASFDNEDDLDKYCANIVDDMDADTTKDDYIYNSYYTIYDYLKNQYGENNIQNNFADLIKTYINAKLNK